MPEPFATPVIDALPRCSGTLASLGRVSVVRMASANLRRWSGDAPAPEIRAGNLAFIFSNGSGTPMTPVDEGNTSEARALRSRAAAEHTDSQARIPAGPVAQFAFPEFTITARISP